MTSAPIEVLHVGSASRDLDARRPARLAAGRRRDVRGAHDGPARAADRGVSSGVDDAGRRRDASSTFCDEPGSTSCSARLAEGPVFDEPGDARRAGSRSATRSGVPLAVPALPSSWRAARAWSLVPVAGEVGDAWAAEHPGRRGTWRSAGRGSCAIWQPGERGRAPTPGSVGARSVAPTWSASAITTSTPATPLATLVAFLHPGADLLVTQGSRGGLLVIVGRDGPPETLRYLPTATDREIDPTGAGDTFLAALLASVLRPAIVGRTRVAPSPGPAVRGRGRLARGRGPGARRRPGPRGRARPACARTGPARGHPECGITGRDGRRWTSTDASGCGPAGPPAPDRPLIGKAVPEAHDAAVQVGLERGLRTAEPSAALDGVEAVERRRQRAGPVPQPMLAELGELDRGDDRGPARTGRKQRPGIGGVGMPSEPAQQVGALDRDPLGRPGCVERGRPWRTERRPDGSVAAEVGRPAWRPPRLLGFGPVGGAGRDQSERRADERRSTGATGRSTAASRQSSASPSRRSRANARASPARSPGGASARPQGSP